MAFPVIGGTQESGYNIDNSLRLNPNDNQKLSRTPASEGNRKTFTISFWQKKADPANNNDHIMGVQGSDDATNFEVVNHTSQAFQIGLYHVNAVRTNRLFRDPGAWNHYFFFFDTTQSSESDRFKLYIDGVQETSFSQSNIPAQNASLGWGRNVLTNICNSHGGTAGIDAYLAEFYYIDGQAKAPTDFGEFDDNGVWIAKNYTGSFGTNGCKLEFKQVGTAADADGIGADTSGNDNHFSQTNIVPANNQSIDTPTNNFCTANPLQRGYPPSYLITLKEGNLQAEETSSNWIPYDSTMAVTNGKWYWECKNVSGSPSTGFMFGIQAQEGQDITGLFTTDNRYPGYYSGRVGFSYHSSGTYYYNGSQTTSGSVTFTTGDIIMLALDMDNGFLYVGKNGSWNNSGNPTSGASGTGNVYNGFSGKTISPCNALNGSSVKAYLNFGSPVVASSSGNTDGKYGDFEYAPPSGYYALCTKRLAEYG